MALRGNRQEQLAAVCRKLGTLPKVAVETGTFRGDTTYALSQLFDRVWTIELSPHYHALATDRFRDTNVQCILGDSEHEVARLCRGDHIEEPVFWFLDAHWPDGWPDEYKQHIPQTNPLPLAAELRAIVSRSYTDIIVVDDISSFGRPGLWTDITIETLLALVKPHTVHRMADSLAMLRVP